MCNLHSLSPLQTICSHLLSHFILRHPFFAFTFKLLIWGLIYSISYPLPSLPLYQKNATALSLVSKSICIQGLQNSHKVELQLILCTGLLPDSEILQGKSLDLHIIVSPVSSTDFFFFLIKATHARDLKCQTILKVLPFPPIYKPCFDHTFISFI